MRDFRAAFWYLVRDTKGVTDMFSKSIVIAACAAALFVAGCGPSKEEIAKQNAQVAALRESLAKARDCARELIVLKGKDAPGVLRLEVDIERADKLLSQPADVKQLPKLESALKEFNGSADALQAEIDRRTEEVHKANEEVRKAADAVRRFDAEHGL